MRGPIILAHPTGWPDNSDTQNGVISYLVEVQIRVDWAKKCVELTKWRINRWRIKRLTVTAKQKKVKQKQQQQQQQQQQQHPPSPFQPTSTTTTAKALESRLDTFNDDDLDENSSIGKMTKKMSSVQEEEEEEKRKKREEEMREQQKKKMIE